MLLEVAGACETACVGGTDGHTPAPAESIAADRIISLQLLQNNEAPYPLYQCLETLVFPLLLVLTTAVVLPCLFRTLYWF